MAKELTYFKTPNTQEPLDPLTAQEARRIIRLFKYGKDETRIFEENNIPTHKIEGAKKEWLRLKEEVYRKIAGSDNYKPTTKTDLQNTLSASALFSAKEVVDDILAYDEKSPAKPLTFTQFRDKYYKKELEEGAEVQL